MSEWLCCVRKRANEWISVWNEWIIKWLSEWVSEWPWLSLAGLSMSTVLSQHCAPDEGCSVATPSCSVTRQWSGNTPAPVNTMSGAASHSALPISVVPSWWTIASLTIALASTTPRCSIRLRAYLQMIQCHSGGQEVVVYADEMRHVRI